jgi:L-iditol 2-dehydrogenase
VDGWQPGDRVVGANSAPCGECFYCKADREELCEDLLFLNGAYAEYLTVPERIVRKNLLRVPEGLTLEAAALVEPLACALHGVEETEVRTGDTVVIVGAGPLGLLLAYCAVRKGARVLVVGRREARLRAALAVGAAEVLAAEPGADTVAWVRERTGGRGADRVIEATGQPEAWEEAIRLVRKGGRVNLFGGCPSGTSIRLDTGRLHYDALTLLGSFHHTPRAIRAALEMLTETPVLAAVLVQERASLEGLPDLLARLARGGGPLKMAVVP